MAVEIEDTTLIEHQSELVVWLEQGCKSKSERSIGTEHEKFIFRHGKTAPVVYEPDGIAALLENLNKELQWQEVIEADYIIGLTNGKASISLEPGGQFELSGAPLKNLHETSQELDAHINAVKRATQPLQLSALGVGLWPLAGLEDMPRMPKRRYDIMRGYMPKVGILGLDMMHRTCTVQANLDFTSENDMAQIMRIGMGLQPVVTALFSASPFSNSRPNGFRSFRAEIWRQTDADRCGILPFVFDPGMSFERYVDWAVDVPLYFVKRSDIYHDVAGMPFRALLEGKLPQLPGMRATLADWSNHLGTLFPEVRLKRFIEMRGADCGPLQHIKALPALWVGLLYDDAARDGALELIKNWSAADVQALYAQVPMQGLSSTIKNRAALDIAREVVDLAISGLRRRGIKNTQGNSEEIYLEYLQDCVVSGKSAADEMLEKYNGEWNKNIKPLFTEYELTKPQGQAAAFPHCLAC